MANENAIRPPLPDDAPSDPPTSTGTWLEIDSIPLIDGHPRAEFPRFDGEQRNEGADLHPCGWVERHFQESAHQFARVGDTLRSNGARFGCGYAEIVVTADAGAVHVSVDSGIPVPKERIDEVNKLSMLCNRLMRLAGFAPVFKPGDTVKFTFDLARSAIERDDRTLRENTIAADMLASLMEDTDDGETAASLARHLARETKLERAIGMAAVSVKSYIGQFAAVACEGRSALDVFEA